MTPDLKTAARAALVEQIARICEPEGFYHGQWAVPSHRARGLAKAAAILAAIEPAIRADERAQVVGEAAARTTAPHGVCYATVRVAEDKHGFEELHIECRMQDGQKGAFVRVDVEFDDLAHWIADALSKPPVDPAAIRAAALEEAAREAERPHDVKRGDGRVILSVPHPYGLAVAAAIRALKDKPS